jgi:hypothetical protein
MNYYIYYKLTAEQARELRPAVDSLFAKIKAQCGIQGRWMRRRDDPATYMEVYEGVGDEAAFEALLESESAGMGIPRRLERFICV